MSIKSVDLEEAFKTFECQWQKYSHHTQWQDIKLLFYHSKPYLRIVRALQPQLFQSEDLNEAEDVDEAEDDEALQIPAASSFNSSVIYDIVYSSSYQVPVVYFTVMGFSSKQPPLDELHKQLVPDSHRAQVQAVGVIGALSLTEHPLTGLPAYFVHPCRTQEAMKSLLAERQTIPAEYLLLWFGTFGASVGLQVPVEIAQGVSSVIQRSGGLEFDEKSEFDGT